MKAPGSRNLFCRIVSWWFLLSLRNKFRAPKMPSPCPLPSDGRGESDGRCGLKAEGSHREPLPHRRRAYGGLACPLLAAGNVVLQRAHIRHGLVSIDLCDPNGKDFLKSGGAPILGDGTICNAVGSWKSRSRVYRTRVSSHPVRQGIFLNVEADLGFRGRWRRFEQRSEFLNNFAKRGIVD